MKEFRGTKGKWHVGEVGKFGTQIGGCSPNYVACAYDGGWDRSDKEVKANAHLIAAAPELLEALQGLVAITDESLGVTWFHMNGEVAYWSEFPEVENAIRAINKALGEEQ